MPIPDRGWIGFFVPLNVRSLRIYWLGQACSLIGMWLQVTAMGILAYELSGGAGSAVGTLAALNSAPFLLFGMTLGALGDRYDRRSLLLVVQYIQIGIALVLCALESSGLMQLWMLYSGASLLGVLQCIAFPSQQAFVGDLSPRGMLLKSISMYSLVFNVCRSVGPPLAGFVIASLGKNCAFALNALCCVPLVIALICLKSAISTNKTNDNTKGDLDKTKRSGLKVVWGDPRLRMILISALIQNTLGQSFYQIVPALTYGSPESTGAILGAVGAGAVSSILFVLPFLSRNQRIGLSLSNGTLWMGVMIALAGLFPILRVQIMCFFLAGIATSALFVTTSSTVQLLAPDKQRSSILGLFTIVTIGAQPLAALAWGTLLDFIGVPATLMLVGGIEILLSAAMLRNRFWTHWRLLPVGPTQKPS